MTTGKLWSFTTKKGSDLYDGRHEYYALIDSGPVDGQKTQVWGDTKPTLQGTQRVRFGPNKEVAFDLDSCNMNMPFHIGGRYVHELGRLNGGQIDMGYLHGDESGVWSRPYKMLEGIRIDIAESGQSNWTLNDCTLTTNHFAYLEFHFENNGLEVTRKDLPSDTDYAMFYLLNVKNNSGSQKTFTLKFTFEENIRHGWHKPWQVRMGFDTIAQHGDSFAAFDSYSGQVAVAFGGASAPDRTSIESGNPYNNKGILEYDITLDAHEDIDLEFLCAQYDSVKQGAPASTTEGALDLFDNLKGTGASQLTAKVAAWEDDLYNDSVRLVCPDATLRNGFYAAKFSLRTLRNDNRNYHRYQFQFACSTNYVSLFGIDNLFSFSGGVAAGLWDIAEDTMRDMDYFGRLHPNSLIYKTVMADPLGLPRTGDARVQESTMFVRQVWDYARWTGNTDFVSDMYNHCAGYVKLTQDMDTNGNLFPEGMCQPNAGNKDTDENIDGASYLWSALDAMANMAGVLGHTQAANDYRRAADELAKAINADFWDSDNQVWAAWLDVNGEKNLIYDPVKGKSHPSVLAPMRVGCADWTRGRACCDTLNNRCVTERGFRGPACTAWSSGMLAMANYRYGNSSGGKSLIDSCVAGATQDDMFCPSYSNTMGGSPGARRKIHYSWSAGPPLEAIICGMFGLSPNAFEDSVTFTPQIPDDWSSCSLDNVKIGDHIVHFQYDKPNWTVTHVSGTGALTVAYRAAPPSELQNVQSITPGSSHAFGAPGEIN